ncbi:MAG: methylated-DNA--[protein]-cysteine S-methyltransferase [Polyangiaceae bacterium]
MHATRVLGFTTFDTPLGAFAFAWSDAGLVALALPSQTPATVERQLFRIVHTRALGEEETKAPVAGLAPPAWALALVEDLKLHVAGTARDFASTPLDLRNLTEFRVRVYEAARKVHAGSTVSYADLARAAASPGSARAVGRAMATNPFPIVVPCHRIVAANGALHGFSAPGGLRTKARLLEIERAPLVTPRDRNLSLFD